MGSALNSCTISVEPSPLRKLGFENTRLPTLADVANVEQ